jgi:hypothetical protein
MISHNHLKGNWKIPFWNNARKQGMRQTEKTVYNGITERKEKKGQLLWVKREKRKRWPS